MRFGQKKGFSLIEIGIVMVVIGLIIAAVMKGKDVIKSAEIKNDNQAYFGKWINVADGYYDKTKLFVNGDPVASVEAAGLAHPPLSVTVDGEEQDQQTVTVSFFTNVLLTTGGLVRNVVCFDDVPGDIALSVDRLIDGQTGTGTGNGRIFATSNASTAPATMDTLPIVLANIDAATDYRVCRIMEHSTQTPVQGQ